jgi:hypothetical protein
MQGFLFARPVPAAQIDRLLADAEGLSTDAPTAQSA